MKTIRPTEDSNVDIAADERLEVRLPGQGAAGYEWQLESSDARGVESSSRFVPSERGIGGGGEHVFEILAARAGHYQLVFRLARPWERAAAREITIDVDVR